LASQSPVSGPLKISGEIADQGVDKLALKGFTIAAAGSDFAGDGVLAYGGAKPSVSGKFRSKLVDLTKFVPPPAAAGGAAPPSRAAAPADGRLIPDAPLPFELLDRADADLEFTIDALRAPNAKLDNLRAKLAMGGGTLSLKPASFDMDGGKFTIETTLTGKDRALVQKVEGRGIEVGRASPGPQSQRLVPRRPHLGRRQRHRQGRHGARDRRIARRQRQRQHGARRDRSGGPARDRTVAVGDLARARADPDRHVGALRGVRDRFRERHRQPAQWRDRDDPDHGAHHGKPQPAQRDAGAPHAGRPDRRAYDRQLRESADRGRCRRDGPGRHRGAAGAAVGAATGGIVGGVLGAITGGGGGGGGNAACGGGSGGGASGQQQQQQQRPAIPLPGGGSAAAGRTAEPVPALRRGSLATAASGAKRPYSEVTIVEEGGRYGVRLDAKPLRAPSGTLLVAPTRPLAAAIAEEWRDQPAKIDIARAPLTRLLGTALDRIPANRKAVESELRGYAETELVCHRVEHPPALARRQAEQWQPLLEWFARSYDAPLSVTTGVLAVRQPQQSLDAIARALAAIDALRLTGFSLAVGTAGSLVIGAALSDGHLTPDQAFAAAELDASFQIEQWGEDAEATRRRAQLRAELELVDRWHRLIAD
jgi:chaperone required for assembly of F1-ATPase